MELYMFWMSHDWNVEDVAWGIPIRLRPLERLNVCADDTGAKEDNVKRNNDAAIRNGPDAPIIILCGKDKKYVNGRVTDYR
jgi:hypothetical protein